MNLLKVFQFFRVFRPQFQEQRNTEDEIAAPRRQHVDYVPGKRKRSSHLFVATDPA